MNTFGNIFKLTTFGESHGEAIGGIIDGCPSGIVIDFNFIQEELDRRKPGQSHITTPRKEKDNVEFFSGIFEGKTTGTPIGFIIKNQNQKSKDYDNLKNLFRPSHADFTYYNKYGIRDYRGGGRSSARETASRVVAGAIAKIYLRELNINISAYTSQIGNISLKEKYSTYNSINIEDSIVRCPDKDISDNMIALIQELRKKGDTIGGVISCIVTGVPIGLGEPVFNKLQSMLASAMLSINASKAFEYGHGFDIEKTGSELNDTMYMDGDKISFHSNNSGGIQGGISNGEPICFRIAFKPIATISINQQTVDIENTEKEIKVAGRHDTCVIPRAVPIVEAMTALTIVDSILLNRSHKK